MASFEEQAGRSSALPDPPDWELLSALFASNGPNRHRMGLRRAEARTFYAATAAGPAILEEKRRILDHDGERHTIVTPVGHRAATEFACLPGIATEGACGEGDNSDGSLNRRLSLALEPDLLFVQPPDWTAAWASVCFPTRWSLEGKALQPLSLIHGAVPNLNAELGSKIAAFFSRLVPGEGWRRANWGLSASCSRNQHPDVSVPALTTETHEDQIFIRIEDQHLLKLLETGAIAFGIRIATFAWSEVRQNEEIAASLLQKLRSMSPEIAEYKAIREIIPRMPE